MLANEKIEKDRKRGQRAFTLVELLVAITAGLFVALGAFALAKQGSRFFQQEARVANAQFSATLGFDRLRADIARAGFLSTANVQRDPLTCGIPSGLPVGITSLAAVRLTATSPPEAQDSINGLAPDQITLSGSYSTPETFPVRSVFPNGSKFDVFLQPNNGATARAGGIEGGTLSQIFQAGRVLRILDATGRYEFGEIEGYAVNGGGQMVITLKQAPAIAFKRLGGTCGVEGFGVGMQANVVNRIRYEIRNLKAAPPDGYKPLYSDAATAPGDETRLDLVRVELNADNSEQGSVELVAEYAVDLKFGLTVVPNIAGGTDPALSVFPIGDPQNYQYAYEVTSPAPAGQMGPERIRSVRARFAVRSREADRAAAITAPTGNIFRYSMGNDAGFARTRTLTADIGLPNLASLKW